MDDNDPSQDQLNDFIQRFTAKIGQLRNANQTLVQKVTDDTAFYPAVQQSLEGLNRIVQEINNKITAVKKRVSVLRDDNEMNSQELEDEQKTQSTLVELINRNSQQRQHITGTLLPQNHQHAQDLQAQLADCNTQLADCRAQLAQAQAALQHGDAQQQRLAAEIQQKIGEHQAAINDLNNQHQTDIQNQAAQLNTQHQTDLQNLNGQHQTDIQNQAAQLTAQHQTDLQNLQDTHTQELADQSTQINNAHQQVIGQLVDQHNQLQQQKDALQQNYDGLQQHHDNLNAAHNQLRQEKDALQQHDDNLNAAHNQLLGENNDLQAAHAQSADNINTLRQQRTALIAAIRQADAAIDESIRQIGLIINSGASAPRIRELLQGLLEQLTDINRSIGDVPNAPAAAAAPAAQNEQQFRPEVVSVRIYNGVMGRRLRDVVISYDTLMEALDNDRHRATYDRIQNNPNPLSRRDIEQILDQARITFNETRRQGEHNKYTARGGKYKNMKKANKKTKKIFKQKAGFVYPKHNMIVPFQKRKNIQYSRSSNKITSKNSNRIKSKSSTRSSRR